MRRRCSALSGRRVAGAGVVATAVGVLVATMCAAASVGAAPRPPVPLPEPVPVPVPSLPPLDDSTLGDPQARLIVVPVGCAAPDREQAVFVGTLQTRDAATARFRIDSVRAGSVQGFALDDLIDVRYGDEVRFLTDGAQYIVGVGIDPEQRALVSSVRTPAPLFGGSEVAEVNAGSIDCPVVDEPVRTINVDGTEVESGVLSPLAGKGSMLLRAVLQPVGVALLVLLGLVAVKQLVFALGRTLRDLR